MLKRINAVLPELILGILIYGVVLQLAGVWFVADKLRYSSGLWIGVAIAAGMAIHMAIALRDAADIAAEEPAKRKVIFASTLRYGVVVLLCFLVVYFDLGNLVTLFLGVTGLKAGAYLQPLTHKAVLKLTGRREESSDSKE